MRPRPLRADELSPHVNFNFSGLCSLASKAQAAMFDLQACIPAAGTPIQAYIRRYVLSKGRSWIPDMTVLYTVRPLIVPTN
jgi:hypothetical protein